jgi:peptidylprolyl isomerase
VGQLRNGRVFDSTADRGPLEITLGSGQTLASFEEAIVGMVPGESKTVVIPCRLGYGAKRKHMVRTLRPDLVPPGKNLKPGQRLRITLEEGGTSVVTVTRVAGGQVLVDMNHPLAGEDLIFKVDLLAVL